MIERLCLALHWLGFLATLFLGLTVAGMYMLEMAPMGYLVGEILEAETIFWALAYPASCIVRYIVTGQWAWLPWTKLI